MENHDVLVGGGTQELSFHLFSAQTASIISIMSGRTQCGQNLYEIATFQNFYDLQNMEQSHLWLK